MKTIRQKLSSLSWRAVLLLSAMLVCAQISALEHNAEHFSHGHQELCHSFVACDNSANPSTSSDFSILPMHQTKFDVAHSILSSLDTVQFSPIRAPPQATYN